jgi:hypothetical protein
MSKKIYLIGLFLKCSQHLFAAKKHLKLNEEFLHASFQSVSDDDFAKIMSLYGSDKYSEEITPIVDSHFSEEEVDSLIKFFRSTVGKKLIDKNYLLKSQKVIEGILEDRERELSKIEKE